MTQDARDSRGYRFAALAGGFAADFFAEDFFAWDFFAVTFFAVRRASGFFAAGCFAADLEDLDDLAEAGFAALPGVAGGTLRMPISASWTASTFRSVGAGRGCAWA